MLTISYKTHIPLTFTHSRLLKHKAGPGVAPGTFPLEGDLAESWTQPNETTYVFKLRQGRALARQAPGQRPRADRRRRRLHGRALPDRQGQRLRVHAEVASTRSRPSTSYTVQVHAQGALRLVPRHAGQSHGRGHRGQGVRREVRRSQEARVRRRHRAVDARQLPAQPRHDLRAQPGLLRARACPTSTGSRCPSTRTTPRAWPPS